MKRVLIFITFVLSICATEVCAQSSYTFLGTMNQRWSDAKNWKEGMKPTDPTDIVHLLSSVTVDENASVMDLFYDTSSICVTVASGYKLSVFGLINHGKSQSFIVEDSAQLVCNREVKAMVCKKISPYYNSKDVAAMHFIASPIERALQPSEVDSLIPEDGNFELMRFNQSNSVSVWERYADPAYQSSFYLNNGQGYLYSKGSQAIVSFVGLVLPNDVPLSFPLDYYEGEEETVAKGLNLMGNPFSCNAYLDRSYYCMNGTGTDLELVRASANQPVAPCTGMFVQATEAGQTVSFSRTPLIVDDKGCIRLTLMADDEVVDEAVLSFNEDDALGKFSFVEPDAYLYFKQDDLICSIGTSEIPGQKALYLKTNANGNFVLKVMLENADITSLYLVDNITGTEVNLITSPSYAFSASTSDYVSRFKLYVNTNHGIEETVEETSFACFRDGNIVISEETDSASLQVVDMTGRVVKEAYVEGCNAIPFAAAPGVYLLRLASGQAVRTQKIVVR